MILCAILVLSAQYLPAHDTLIRGVYVNSYQASRRDYWKEIFNKADSGFINTVVVDLKGDYGFLAYDSKLKKAKEIDAVKKHVDIDYLIENAALHNIKLIARIVCFRDNYLSQYKRYGIRNDSGEMWRDNKSMAWTNPYDPAVQEYLLSVTREIVDRGITSVAFDYIRFPTDGDVGRIRLTHVKGSHVDAVERFLKMVRDSVDAEIGMCVFGFATIRPLRAEGQDLEQLGEHIDVLYPMLYPSHFHRSFNNDGTETWRNFWIYFDSVKGALAKLPYTVSVVPFVQGFEYRAKDYDPDYVFSQINGALSAGSSGFIIWNARSDYDTCWTALEWTNKAIALRRRQKHMDRTGSPRYFPSGLLEYSIQ